LLQLNAKSIRVGKYLTELPPHEIAAKPSSPSY
jgi:hypothetical protein